MNNEKLAQSFKAEEFLALMAVSAGKNLNPSGIINDFLANCWEFEDRQAECFAALGEFLRVLPQESKAESVTLLVNNGMTYPKLVFLAKELFDTMSATERQNVRAVRGGWPCNAGATRITEAEYKWRLKHKKTCWRDGCLYLREAVAEDGRCYHTMCDITRLS